MNKYLNINRNATDLPFAGEIWLNELLKDCFITLWRIELFARRKVVQISKKVVIGILP